MYFLLYSVLFSALSSVQTLVVANHASEELHCLENILLLLLLLLSLLLLFLYGPGVDSAPTENEYQEHFLGVKAAGA
jgi:hypothetical protein